MSTHIPEDIMGAMSRLMDISEEVGVVVYHDEHDPSGTVYAGARADYRRKQNDALSDLASKVFGAIRSEAHKAFELVAIRATDTDASYCQGNGAVLTHRFMHSAYDPGTCTICGHQRGELA